MSEPQKSEMAKHSGMQVNGMATSVEDLVAQLSTAALPKIRLGTGRTNRPLRSTQKPAVREFHIWRAATQGTRVLSGTIDLPERGILLLMGHGAHFNGTTFRGAFIVAAAACKNVGHS